VTPSRPPRFAESLFACAADPERRDAQLGDLAEEFEERASRDPASARWWYRRQALASLGPSLAYRLARAQRRIMTIGGDGMMSTVSSDLRIALRGMRRELGVNGVVVATVALGIGAIATTFSVVHGLVLDPFPFPEADRIVGVGTAYPRLSADLGFFENLSPAEFEDIRDNTTTLEDVVAWDMGNRQIDTEGPPENVFTAFWWGDALTTLQMDAHLGRSFSVDELRDRSAVAMISYDLWVNRFGADSTMIGGTISVGGTPFTLVGIVPEGVDIYGTDLWTLMAIGPERYARNRRQFQVMGRIAEGSSLAAVNAELAGLAARVEQDHAAEFAEYAGWTMQAMTWSDVSSQLFRTGAFVLMGAVSFVLLLVCANTANLLLARAQGRRREMAVRTALGAGRGRLVGQLLTESLALAAVGGALGVALAYLGVRGVNAFLDTLGISIAGTVEMNGPVLAFTAAAAVGAGILFGLAPALHASAAGLAEALQADGRGATGNASRQRLQRTLVGVEVVLAFLLLAGGGLLINSFVRMNRVDPGFEPEGVLTMRLTLPRERYDGEEVPAFFRELTDRLEAIPGVVGAGAGTQFPPVAFSFQEVFFDAVDADAEATLPTALATVVTPGYFETLGVPLRRGRVFDDGDAAGAPLVAVINEEAARRYFGDDEPVGRRLKLGGAAAETPWWEIVGVVGATKNLGLDADPFPEIFAVHEQVGGIQNQLFLLIAAETDPRALIPAVRSAVLEMDPDQPVYAIRTVEEALRQGVAPMRATTLVLSIFAGFALALAAVGIYSVVSYTVSERTREIGLRVALGADEARVRRLVVRQALLPVLIGAAIGIGGALAASGALERLLFDVSGSDPLTLGAVAVLLVGVAAVASWVPAFRASRMDPVEALRVD
jgi:putative ABC transport system permease protein